MSSTPRRLFPLALAAVGLTLAGAALAWACTPQAGIYTNTTVGPPGTSVTVTGSVFEEGGPVEIYWNGGGAMLARATGPSFSVAVTIPNAPPDTYTIYAVGRSANGAVAGRASTSFTIPGAPEPAPTPGAAPPPERGVSSPSSGTTTGRERARSGSTARGATGGKGARARGESRTSAGAPAGAGTSQGVTTLPSGTTVFADSVTSTGAAAKAAAGRGRQSERGSARSRAAASQRSAAGDLWAGFGSDKARGLLAGSTAPPEASGSVPTLAAALLALGALSVLAGLGVAGTRRRRRAASGGRIDAD